MDTNLVEGDHRGIRYAHAYLSEHDHRQGTIWFPEGEITFQTEYGDGAPDAGDRLAIALIDQHYRDIDLEPDDDSEQ
jgi:hypothetical protein